MFQNRKTSFVHDWIDTFGGAERVVEALLDILQPEEFFTLIANPNSELTKRVLPILKTSVLQKIPFAFHLHRYLLQLYPALIESFDVSNSKLIVSSSHCVAKGVMTKSDQLHISYIYTPARYLWDQTFDYLEQNRVRGLRKIITQYIFHKMRIWDVTSSSRVDLFIGISHLVASRVWRCYRRPAMVIYPFVDIDRFQYVPTLKKQNYFVAFSRLVSQKRIDLAVRACSEMGLPLKVIGAGPKLNELQKMAGPSVEFLGRLSDQESAAVLQSAQGLIFSPEEDFGIVPLEAMAVGTPVLAFGRGGALETIIKGKTGDFYYEQSVEGLKAALKSWDSSRYEIAACRARAAEFSRARFCEAFQQVVVEAIRWKSENISFDDQSFISNFNQRQPRSVYRAG